MPCHDADVLPYTAYLRVYEPVTAFPEPARTLWTAYADSRRRPRRIHALAAEHTEAKRRLASSPPVVVPEHESRDGYVRRSNDTIYVCPWETRLRSWLAHSRFRRETPSRLADFCVPETVSRQAEASFERWRRAEPRPLQPHILSSNWHVPLAWFVLFTAQERCLMLGEKKPRVLETPNGPSALGEPDMRSAAMASGQRTLIYVTSMGEARARVEAALPIVRVQDDDTFDKFGLSSSDLEELARWLGAFAPDALLELDYGGLVHLLDDGTLTADESAAELSVALAATARRERELSVAMY
ncbi:hypothetical protein ACFQ07_27875, partial [Actinomadura adrarensis]